MPRVLMVAYRLPVTDQNEVIPGSLIGLQNGGAVTGAEWLAKRGQEVVWIGYNGTSKEEEEPKLQYFAEKGHVPVYLDHEIAKAHFNEFCKIVLWPLFHYYGNAPNEFNENSWKGYKAVNEQFAKTIESVYKPGDSIFIQDYHLMLVPSLLREKLPLANIMFFLHIPWPSSELYRCLPVRNEVLLGLLGSDVVTFQTFAYARHFMSACTRLLGLTVTSRGVEQPDSNGSQFVRVEVVPIGINPQHCYDALDTPLAKERVAELKKAFEGFKIIVSRDRTEYVKGIPHKLRAFRTFLNTYPEWQGKVILFQECRPNSEVMTERHYMNLQEDIETLVGAINGQYGSITYTPIQYLNKPLSWPETCALFSVADLALITPLRDGMNLTSHEFIACQREKMSPLILSEFAGSAQCLSGAIVVNPWDYKKIAKAIHEALNISPTYRKIRYEYNIEYVTSHDAAYWITSCLKELNDVSTIPTIDQTVRRINMDMMMTAYQQAKKRLIFLDYDGTLTPIVKVPQKAHPSKQLISILESLCADPRNIVYIITGRDRSSLEKWLGKIPVGMSCEHGAFLRPYQQPQQSTTDPVEWENLSDNLNLSWKEEIEAIFADYADRTPGSFIEVKEINLTWHYRNAEQEFGEHQKNDLLLHLQSLPNLPIDILVGKKAIEVRPRGVNKGSVVRRLTAQNHDADFLLCIGDDKTDEDMFEATMKESIQNTFNIVVEQKPSAAQYYVDNQSAVLTLLKKLAGY